MPKAIKSEVEENGELRKLITRAVKERVEIEKEADDSFKLSAKDRGVMVENIVDLVADTVDTLVDSLVENEFDIMFGDDEDEDDEDDEVEEVEAEIEEGTVESDEEPIDADFEEAA